MTTQQARAYAKQVLSPKRFRHTKNVAAAAKMLAMRFGADEKQAELAAWLHDVCKEKSRAEQLQLLAQDAIIAGSTERRPQPIWHGPCAAILAKHTFGVDDAGVLGAICNHTTGKAEMSLLDKVVFLADIISAERTFAGVDEIRRVAETDLDKAVMMAMEENIAYLTKKGKPLDEHTVEALAWLKSKYAD